MKRSKLADAMEYLGDDLLTEALMEPHRRRPWIKWAALAACLCLVVAAALWVPAAPAEVPADTQNGPPSLTVEDRIYIISPYVAVTDTLPEGFRLAGQADVGGLPDCPYYQDPDMPIWIYVYQEVRTDGTVDETGTLTATEPHDAYVRYVDARLRGRELICYGGQYYISLWSADPYGDAPDVTRAAYDDVESRYGLRMEGEPPGGFVPVGTADFTGLDTVPTGALASNTGAELVCADPADPSVILVETQWHTAPDETGEVLHTGWNVYLRYDCPWVP